MLFSPLCLVCSCLFPYTYKTAAKPVKNVLCINWCLHLTVHLQRPCEHRSVQNLIKLLIWWFKGVGWNQVITWQPRWNISLVSLVLSRTWTEFQEPPFLFLLLHLLLATKPWWLLVQGVSISLPGELATLLPIGVRCYISGTSCLVASCYRLWSFTKVLPKPVGGKVRRFSPPRKAFRTIFRCSLQ